MPGTPPAPSAALSQYDTPRHIASKMAAWARVTPGMRVLEPSAGLGNIADAVATWEASVECIELDSVRAAYLFTIGYRVGCADFLSVPLPNYPTEHFDLVIGNPPYENGQDLEHVLHSLNFAPRVVMLLPLGNLDGVERHERLWSKHTLNRLAVLVRRFKAEGSEHPGQRPFGVFEILRGKQVAQQSIEWWS
jgi:16S rRNA A1518/A1519 N6-dimethyltransferase RsmA/KsgA/DIM1 with predicted DNA glycosylase/AP lyase activity